MGQLAQLSEAEIEERFHISGRRAILFSLDGHVRQRAQFTVHFNEGRESFLTYLLAVAPLRGEVVIDRSGSGEVNARFHKSARNIFVARPDGISVQFACGAPRRVVFDGDDAFALPLPEFIVRLQRRDFFRIATPLVRPIMLNATLPGERPGFSLGLHDLSVAGCGLSAASVPAGLEAGMTLPCARFVLPDHHHTLVSGPAVVRHVTALTAASGAGQLRIGLQFGTLDRTLEHPIQRYIAQIEHERHELLAK